MGTNYYFEIDGERYHIGKCSGGWRFTWEWKSIFELMLRFNVKIMIYVSKLDEKVNHVETIIRWLSDIKEVFADRQFGVIDVPGMSEKMFFEAFEELCNRDFIKIVDEYGLEYSSTEFIEMVENKQSEMTPGIYKLYELPYSVIDEIAKECNNDIHFLPKKYLEEYKEYVKINNTNEVRIGGLIGFLYEFS